MKDEEATPDIEEVKAHMEDVAVERNTGSGGGEGVSVVTPWLGGEAGHAWGLSHANQRNVLTRPWVRGALGSGYSPDAPPFFERPALGILPPFAAPHQQQGCWGAWQYTGGAWAWKPLPGKPLSPIPEPIGAGDLTQAKVFPGPGEALMRGSHCKRCFLHWEESAWVKVPRSRRKLECIPQWESILWGVYEPRRQASYEGAVEGLTITRPIKHLGRAAPATSSTTAPTGGPQGTPPSSAAHFRTAVGHGHRWKKAGFRGICFHNSFIFRYNSATLHCSFMNHEGVL